MKSITNWIHVNVKICIIAVTEFSASFRSSRWGNCLKTGSRISAERGIDLIAEGLLGYSILLLFFLLNPDVFTEQKYQSVEWSFALVKPWVYQMASFDVLLWSLSINFRHTACILCEGQWLVLITEFHYEKCEICSFDKYADAYPSTWNGETTTYIAEGVSVV